MAATAVPDAVEMNLLSLSLICALLGVRQEIHIRSDCPIVIPQAFGGNPEMSAGLDSRQKSAGIAVWCYAEDPESLC
jgi:hypothetical protein